MPIKHSIWRVGAAPDALPVTKLANEKELEEMIKSAPGILSDQWMLIGQQETTEFGGRIDLLAIAPDASLVLIELKRDRTPREIVAQALDYASWVEQLSAERIAEIYRRFSGGENLNAAFKAHYGAQLDEESLNASHQIVLVAAELDDSTERIINYLSARDIAINVLFFQVFEDGSKKLLSRAWLIDPGETQANVASTTQSKGAREPWNGEFYVSFGTGESRTWEDARKYGFISAGGGSWYTQTLKQLSPGDRVWVKDPGVGYLGVGRVVAPVTSGKEFMVKTEKGEAPALDVLSTAEFLRTRADDPERAEQFVRIDWLDTVSSEQAIQEVGLFGNQNTVCQPKTPKWRHTIERLKTFFKNWDAR